MADPVVLTQADIEAAVTAAVAKLEEKNAELVAEVRTAKAKARAAETIDPAELTRVEDENARLKTELATAQKAVKTATTERDAAVKSLETETGAARSYAQEAEIADAIASGNVIPALVPAFKAMIQAQAKADLVDGKYVVTIGDKPAREHIATFLASDDGKAFKSASSNGGGGASGGKGGEAGKSMASDAFSALSPKARADFMTSGGVIATD